jgi:hypothetical protein
MWTRIHDFFLQGSLDFPAYLVIRVGGVGLQSNGQLAVGTFGHDQRLLISDFP